MRQTLYIPGILMLILFSVSSCVSRKNLTYLQYKEETEKKPAIDIKDLVTPPEYEILPNDILFIRVITPDPQWSAIFNVTPSGQGGAMTEQSAALLGYQVDLDGNIEIPYVGKVKVEGKNLTIIKNELDKIFKNYVSDASITVRLINNYVTVVGEVRRPGRYPITKYRINIFDAISLAGDLTDYSNRQEIQIVRPSLGGKTIYEFSLNDRDVLASEYYYIMPNDIIYAKPMKGRTFQMNSSIFSLILSSVSTILVITGFFMNMR